MLCCVTLVIFARKDVAEWASDCMRISSLLDEKRLEKLARFDSWSDSKFAFQQAS